jgi:hypothetical protein
MMVCPDAPTAAPQCLWSGTVAAFELCSHGGPSPVRWVAHQRWPWVAIVKSTKWPPSRQQRAPWTFTSVATTMWKLVAHARGHPPNGSSSQIRWVMGVPQAL